MREGRAKCRWPGQRHWMTQDGARGYCEGSQPWVKVDPFTALYIYLLWDQGVITTTYTNLPTAAGNVVSYNSPFMVGHSI